MKYIGLILLLLSFSASASEGIRARLSVKIYEGTTISLHDRNLTSQVECILGVFRTNSFGNCATDIQDTLKEKNSGYVTISAAHLNLSAAEFRLNIMGNGYMGGGQDGPYFSTLMNVPLRDPKEVIFNLGFFSKTPEIAGEYLLKLELISLEECDSLESCALATQ